jgi:hypothetical protein
MTNLDRDPRNYRDPNYRDPRNYRDPNYRDPRNYRDLNTYPAPSSVSSQVRQIPRDRARQLPGSVAEPPKPRSTLSKGLVVALMAVAALGVAAGCALHSFTASDSTLSTASGSAHNGAPASASTAAVALPADLCALNSADKVAATLGSGPMLVDPPVVQQMNQQDIPANGRVCHYTGTDGGGAVFITLIKGVSREQFNADQTQTSAQASQVGATYNGPLPGVADAAFSISGRSNEFGGAGAVTTDVVALDGDMEIKVVFARAGADRVDPAKVGDLIGVLVGELR